VEQAEPSGVSLTLVGFEEGVGDLKDQAAMQIRAAQQQQQQQQYEIKVVLASVIVARRSRSRFGKRKGQHGPLPGVLFGIHPR